MHELTKPQSLAELRNVQGFLPWRDFVRENFPWLNFKRATFQ